ncbi:MAG: hypothetical protein AAF004_10640 [Pseudomonadota bacterium]
MFSAGKTHLQRAMCGGALSVVLLFAGCSGANDSAVDTGVASDPDTSAADIRLASRLYTGTPRTPETFLSEPSQYPDRSEFKFHVSNNDIGASPDSAVRFEVCSDDFAQALQWSAVSADARALSSALTATYETSWYFQFDRDVNSAEPAMVVNRVFKCAALDRSTRDTSGNAGVINMAPVTSEDLRFVSEYLWQFSVYNNALHVVIESLGEAQGGQMQHVIKRARLLPSAGAVQGCDRVELWDWTHRIAANGALTETDLLVRDFDVRRDSGVVELCAP